MFKSNGLKGKCIVLIALVICLSLISTPVLSHVPDRLSILGKEYMVVSNNSIATQVGAKVMEEGGNAVDAAIAVGLNKGLVEPFISGHGGSAFAMVYWAETGEIHYLNFSGRSPANLSLDDFPDGLPYRCPTGNTALVPVMFKGYEELRERFGTMSREALYEPTIEMAFEGFPCHHRLAQRWPAWFEEHDGLGKETWWGGSEEPPKVGEIVKNPNLGETLQRISEEGVEVFYGGELGQEFVDYLQGLGSVMTIEDLENATVDWQDPIETTYRGYDLFMGPPNCSGGLAVAQILNIIEGYDIEEMGFNSTEYVHKVIEATKLAIADRAEWVSDPDFHPAPLDLLTSKSYAAERREQIDPEQAAIDVPPGKEREGGTTSFTTADRDGNMVAVVQSNGGGWGSNIIVGDTGMHINNGVAWMEDDPDCVNVVEGNKRARWNMTPVIGLKDGTPFFSAGGSGGTNIWQGLSQLVTKLIDFDMDVQIAKDAPQFTINLYADPINDLYPIAAEALEENVIEELEEKGHFITIRGAGVAVNAIVSDLETGVLYGAGFPLTHGHPAGR